MSPTSVRILFNESCGHFVPGERVTGKVLLVVHREKHILGIDMNFIGKVKVTCIHADRQVARRGHNKRLSSHSYSDKYFILNECKALHREGADESNAEESMLAVGTYEYPFSWALPENIPASFEGPYGWIRYRLEVIVRHSFWDHRCEAESEFFVIGHYDLNNLDRIYREVQVETKGINVYNCYGPNYLELTFELEKKAYVPGEMVRFGATVEFVNRNGHPPIHGVRVALVQEQTYKVKEKTKRYCVKIMEVIGPMVFPGAIEVWNGSMELFPIPPTSLGGACRIIDVQYYLRANLSMSEEDQIDVSFKLQIGTVALRRRRERLPCSTNTEVITSLDIPETENATLNISEMFPNPLLLSQPISSRRASAPPLWIEDTEPVAGPSCAVTPRAVYLDELETPPPSYCDALFMDTNGTTVALTQDSNPNDDPPAYPRQPPFFLRKGAKHLFDSNNVYSTL